MQGNPTPTPQSIGAQPVDALLSALVALAGTGLIEKTGVGTAGTATIGATGRDLIATANQAAARTAMGLGSAATANITEAAWTPTIIGATTAGTATYTSQVGTVAEVGNLVIASASLSWTGHTGTGDMRVSLPVAVGDIAQRGCTFFSPFEAIPSMPASCYLAGVPFQNASQVFIFATPVGGGTPAAMPISASGAFDMVAIYWM